MRTLLRLVFFIFLGFPIVNWGQSIQGQPVSRALCISRSNYELGVDRAGSQGFHVRIWVENVGLNGKPIRLTTTVRTPDGQAVRATPMALPQTVDQEGNLRWIWNGQVPNAVDPLALWTFIPLNVLSLSTPEFHLKIRSDVTCDGLRTYYDGGVYVSQAGVQFQRGVLLSSLFQRQESQVWVQPNPAGMAVEQPNLQTEETVLEVTFFNNVMGLQGQRFYSGLLLKDQHGNPVLPSSLCPQTNIGKSGGIQVQSVRALETNQMQWQDRPHKLPLKWTNLDKTRNQPIIVTCYISSDGFWNVREFETGLGRGPGMRIGSLQPKSTNTDVPSLFEPQKLEGLLGQKSPFGAGSPQKITPPGHPPLPTAEFQMIPGVRHDFDLPGKVVETTVLPQTGGELTHSSFTLKVPPRAVSIPTRLFVKQYNSPPPQSSNQPPQAFAIGPIIDLGPEGTQFRQPVTLSMAYNPTAVPSHLGPENLFAAYFDGQKWVPVPTRVDPNNHTMEVQMDSLPGITFVAAAAVTIVSFTIMEMTTGVFQSNYDGIVKDPAAYGEAYKYVTPRDPIVIQRAQTLIASNATRSGHYEIVTSQTQLQKLYQNFNVNGDLSVVFRVGRGIQRPSYTVIDNWGHDWVMPAVYFQNGMVGDCKNIANAYCSVFRSLGFQAKCVDGEGKNTRHVWCEIALNGTPYYVDEGEMTLLSQARQKGLISQWNQMWDESRQEPYRENWWLKRGVPLIHNFSGSFAPDVLRKLSVHPKDPSGFYRFTPPQVSLTISPDASKATFSSFSFKTESCVMVNDRPSDYSKRGVIQETRVQCLTSSILAKDGDYHGRCKVWRRYHDWDRQTINSVPERKSEKDFDEPWFALRKIDSNGKPYYILQIGHAVNRHRAGGTIRYDLVLK